MIVFFRSQAVEGDSAVAEPSRRAARSNTLSFRLASGIQLLAYRGSSSWALADRQQASAMPARNRAQNIPESS